MQRQIRIFLEYLLLLSGIGHASGESDGFLRNGDDWMVVLVNEDNRTHLGIEIQGLDALEGRTLDLLYGNDSVASSGDR